MTKKKSTKSSTLKKKKTANVRNSGKRSVLSSRSDKKKTAKKKQPASRSAVANTKVSSKKKVKKRVSSKGSRPSTAQRLESTLTGIRRREPRAGQSGDLQGVSSREGADSESVEELVEEGNAFEADVVAGVERARDSQNEVHTHEVSEDDVPQEYLDKD